MLFLVAVVGVLGPLSHAEGAALPREIGFQEKVAFVDRTLALAETELNGHRLLPDLRLLRPLNLAANWTQNGPYTLKLNSITDTLDDGVVVNVDLGRTEVWNPEVRVRNPLVGLLWSGPVRLTLLKASADVTIYVYRNHLAACQVEVDVRDHGDGTLLTDLGEPRGPLKLAKSLLEYLASKASILQIFLRLARNEFFDFSNVALAIRNAATRVACGPGVY